MADEMGEAMAEEDNADESRQSKRMRNSTLNEEPSMNPHNIHVQPPITSVNNPPPMDTNITYEMMNNGLGAVPSEPTNDYEGVAQIFSSVSSSSNLSGLQLSGSLGGNLFILFNLKQLDVSNNQIAGEVPARLPPNSTHMYIQMNEFSGVVPKELFNIPILRLEANIFTDGKPLIIPGDRDNFTGSSPNTSSKKTTSSLFVGLISAGVAVFLVVLCLCVWFYIKSRRLGDNAKLAYKHPKWP
ncbi:probable LRR receptor-like serine/threonine-protein kinase At4g20940 [Papaver somniferum]|uniref:probable LRR receptor-like serine/threonine-protein kinase At4g20940 n=1 Tax=Papaver somniferum TaxID=3469 RepID=UPI000E6FBE02|nr:probable LRR receptor-like serine/threonine-protein kinase At4g20940 [Papaver somniferum]